MFWFFIAVLVVVKSPIGRAIADRLAGRSGGLNSGDLEPVIHELEDRVLDLEERLEMTEMRLKRNEEMERLRSE
ncbi:MAG: hypothetical protein OEZ54_01240 [Gemmatimonadota bacterium]|nr:hypothetical protein [Gemmatimonadota bacterium]